MVVPILSCVSNKLCHRDCLCTSYLSGKLFARASNTFILLLRKLCLSFIRSALPIWDRFPNCLGYYTPHKKPNGRDKSSDKPPDIGHQSSDTPSNKRSDEPSNKSSDESSGSGDTQSDNSPNRGYEQSDLGDWTPSDNGQPEFGYRTAFVC